MKARTHNPEVGRSAMALAMAAAVTGGLPLAARADNPAEAMEMQAVTVVATTPLPGLGVPPKDMPANVQTYGARELGQSGSGNLGDFLEQQAGSVNLNSAQGNPYQADVNFRGFTASPLLGTPQGLSVFVDGVRVNEPFGDAVNWDLIPQAAISSLQIIPGSNPAFGLNTLGGALAIHTKSGSQYPGARIEASAGSFGRKSSEVQYGGRKGNWDWFAAANATNDGGWAEHNGSSVRQFFGKLGWQNETTDLDLSFTEAHNTLEGTQTLPLSFMDNIRQPYTWPDRNSNDLRFLSLKGSHFLSDNLVLGGNAYYRKYRNSNYSSNVNGDYNDPLLPNYDPALPTSTVQATNDVADVAQDSYGFGLQLTWMGELFRRQNQFTLGASGNFGRATYTQDSQDAAFTPERGTIGISPFTRQTDALTKNADYGLFFTDTLHLDRHWTLTASGRYNRARVQIEDQSGTAPALNGDNHFSRFNPAVGVNFTPSAALTAYATYNEGSRAPTPIELACADPNAPCKLPNEFVSDPPLNMVVSKTLETGLRGKLGPDTDWSLALYRTTLIDDIQFISAGAGASNAGYFQNVGRTRRQGLELALSTKWGAFSASARYSYVDATFQTPFTVNAPANSSADANGNIPVETGNRIPGIPRQSLKLALRYEFDANSLGASLNVNGPVHARGDENNQDANGQVPGYAVVNLDAARHIGRDTEIFARVSNLFNRRYANFGAVAENWFAGPGHSFDPANPTNEQFRGPGAPRGIWVGMRHAWR